MSPEPRQGQRQGQVGGVVPLYLGCGPLQIQGKSTKGPAPSAQSQVSQGQAWEGAAGRWSLAATHQETTGLGSPCTRMLMVTSWPSLTDWSIRETCREPRSVRAQLQLLRTGGSGTEASSTPV